MQSERQQPSHDCHYELLFEESFDEGCDQQSDQDMPDNGCHKAWWIYCFLKVAHGKPVDYCCSLVATTNGSARLTLRTRQERGLQVSSHLHPDRYGASGQWSDTWL